MKLIQPKTSVFAKPRLTEAGCLGLFAAYLAACQLALANIFAYTLYSIFGKDIPWYGDLLGAFLLGPFNLTAALICWLVRLCGVAAPFIGG